MEVCDEFSTSLKQFILTIWLLDTLWASGYEIYDRLSEPYQKFLESLTVTFEQPSFGRIAQNGGFEVYDKPRGSPENIGKELKAIHPLVRTNPVTGWKSVFPVGSHVSHVNDVTDQESKRLLDWFLDLVYHNHDLQVRFKWENPNDIGTSTPLQIFCMPRAQLICYLQPFGTIVASSTQLRMIMPVLARDMETESLELVSDLTWTPTAHPDAPLWNRNNEATDLPKSPGTLPEALGTNKRLIHS